MYISLPGCFIGVFLFRAVTFTKICKCLHGGSYTKQFRVPKTFLKSFYKDKRSELMLFNANCLLVLINFHHWKVCFCRHAIAFSHLHFEKILESSINIMKTCLYNVDPLKPHFYIVKLGFTGVYIIFLISAQNIDCGYSLELPHRGGSNE